VLTKFLPIHTYTCRWCVWSRNVFFAGPWFTGWLCRFIRLWKSWWRLWINSIC